MTEFFPQTTREFVLLGVLALILLSNGCQPATATPDPALIAEDYPRVDGSTSTRPLQRLIACEILGVPCIWTEEVGLFGSEQGFVPDLRSGASPSLMEKIGQIWHNGTHDSYMNLIRGEADFILVARSPSQDELRAAQAEGVELDIEAVALDAFVFLVNVQNPVENLALETVRDIYTGKITQWTELEGGGKQAFGAETEIHTYQRNRNSGSQELMEKLVMQGRPMIDSPNMILESMIGPINTVGDDPLGIGYSVYYYATFILPHERVRLIGIEGVEPISDHIADRSYPLTTEVYAVIREDAPQNSSAAILRAWLLTARGQATVAESGYVPLKVGGGE